MSEDLDITGKPIPKEYIRVWNYDETGSFLTLASEFDIANIFPDYTDERYIAMESHTDEEFANFPEFTGF